MVQVRNGCLHVKYRSSSRSEQKTIWMMRNSIVRCITWNCQISHPKKLNNAIQQAAHSIATSAWVWPWLLPDSLDFLHDAWWHWKSLSFSPTLLYFSMFDPLKNVFKASHWGSEQISLRTRKRNPQPHPFPLQVWVTLRMRDSCLWFGIVHPTFLDLGQVQICTALLYINPLCVKKGCGHQFLFVYITGLIWNKSPTSFGYMEKPDGWQVHLKWSVLELFFC